MAPTTVTGVGYSASFDPRFFLAIVSPSPSSFPRAHGVDAERIRNIFELAQDCVRLLDLREVVVGDADHGSVLPALEERRKSSRWDDSQT